MTEHSTLGSPVEYPDEGNTLATTPAAFSLTGRHVLVTGGGRGLGQGIALSAAAAGATVTVVARSGDQLDSTVALAAKLGAGRCIAHPADLSEIAAIPDLVTAITNRLPIDGVVHAAAAQLRINAVDVTPDNWRFIQTLNLEAPFFLSTAIARHQLTAKRPGSHVFIGSLNSTIALTRIAPYVVSKTALVGVARALSAEWSAAGIRANVIGPGFFETAQTEDVLSEPANRARILNRIPMGTLGVPADLGGISVFLLSDASRYLTGQLINVDGGWLAS